MSKQVYQMYIDYSGVSRNFVIEWAPMDRPTVTGERSLSGGLYVAGYVCWGRLRVHIF